MRGLGQRLGILRTGRTRRCVKGQERVLGAGSALGEGRSVETGCAQGVCISKASSPLALLPTAADPTPSGMASPQLVGVQTLRRSWKMQLNMGPSLSSPHSSQLSRREPESHGQAARASPPFLSLLPPPRARLRASSQALLSSGWSQVPKYH